MGTLDILDQLHIPDYLKPKVIESLRSRMTEGERLAEDLELKERLLRRFAQDCLEGKQTEIPELLRGHRTKLEEDSKARALYDYLFDNFVRPTMARRVAAGTLCRGMWIAAFQLIEDIDRPGEVRVRFNWEVRGEVRLFSEKRHLSSDSEIRAMWVLPLPEGLRVTSYTVLLGRDGLFVMRDVVAYLVAIRPDLVAKTVERCAPLRGKYLRHLKCTMEEEDYRHAVASAYYDAVEQYRTSPGGSVLDSTLAHLERSETGYGIYSRRSKRQIVEESTLVSNGDEAPSLVDLLSDQSLQSDPQAITESQDSLSTLLERMNNLPPAQRRAVFLALRADEAETSLKKMCAREGVSYKAVHEALRQAKIRLQ